MYSYLLLIYLFMLSLFRVAPFSVTTAFQGGPEPCRTVNFSNSYNIGSVRLLAQSEYFLCLLCIYEQSKTEHHLQHPI